MESVHWISRVVAAAGFTALAFAVSCALRGGTSNDPPTSTETVRPAYGGILHSTDAGLTWQASNLTGKWVTSISGDSAVTGHGFASVATRAGIELYESRDGGATWSQVGRLPAEAGTWPRRILATRLDGDLRLLAGTRHGLWVSEDEGKTWTTVPGLPEGRPWRLAAIEEDGKTRIFVSIVGKPEEVPERGVYASGDLVTWTKEASGGFRLSESFDRRTVLATDSLGMPLQGLVLSMSGQSTIPLPLRAGRTAGAFDGSAPIIADALLGIYVSGDRGGSWRFTGDCRCGVAAAPDFPASHVAVGGGFRDGIFRTADGGTTWELVLRDPSTVVRGTNEIGSVVFLSANDVVVNNGGGRYWPYECETPPGAPCVTAAAP